MRGPTGGRLFEKNLKKKKNVAKNAVAEGKEKD